MKRFLAAIGVASSLALAGSATAHHMATGIISDDLWQEIDETMDLVESPHLDLDLSYIDRTIMTTIEINDDFVDEALERIDEYRNIPDPENPSATPAIMVVVEDRDPDDGVQEITIIERVGAGESQVLPTVAP
jgi:hypothetical protein